MDLRRFIKWVSLFLAFILVLEIAVLTGLSEYVSSRGFENHETESNLLFLKSDEEYDILFVGVSHARNFSRHKNNLRIEASLGKSLCNLGQGKGACGINEQHFYLKHFYDKGNKTEYLLYVLSPPLLFSETLPIASNTFNFEPFELGFFLKYLFYDTENKFERLSSYVRFKQDILWLDHKPECLERKEDFLTEIDSSAILKGQAYAYGGDQNMERFEISCKRVEQTVQLAQKNGSKVIFMIPPALFGKWIGHDETMEFANKMKDQYGVEVHNFAEVILEPKYYYDHHHLNSDGIEVFTETCLKPIFEGR